MSAMVGERVLVSLAMVQWIELVVRELVEQLVQAERVVLIGLVALSAYAAELKHESRVGLFLLFKDMHHSPKLLMHLLSFSHDLVLNHVRPTSQTVLLELQVVQT